MFKDDGGCFMKIKIVSGQNVPGCVPGIVPAANIICGELFVYQHFLNLSLS